jgi:hypothetical protein
MGALSHEILTHVSQEQLDAQDGSENDVVLARRMIEDLFYILESTQSRSFAIEDVIKLGPMPFILISPRETTPGIAEPISSRSVLHKCPSPSPLHARAEQPIFSPLSFEVTQPPIANKKRKYGIVDTLTDVTTPSKRLSFDDHRASSLTFGGFHVDDSSINIHEEYLAPGCLPDAEAEEIRFNDYIQFSPSSKALAFDDEEKANSPLTKSPTLARFPIHDNPPGAYILDHIHDRRFAWSPYGPVSPGIRAKEGTNVVVTKDALLSEPHLAHNQRARSGPMFQPDTYPQSDILKFSGFPSLQDFVSMRADRTFEADNNIEEPSPPEAQEDFQAPSLQDEPWAVPQEFISENVLLLPENKDISDCSLHHYICSVSFLQHQALIRALRHHVHVEAHERSSLSGVDLALDPFSAVLVFPLAELPARKPDLLSILCEQSRRFSSLLVLFEAFPSVQSQSITAAAAATSKKSLLDPYSPPVRKAISKVRRDFVIAQTMGNAAAETVLQLAFAHDVVEAAKLIRVYGNEVEHRAVQNGLSVLWMERDWLGEEETEVSKYFSCPVVELNAFCFRTKVIWRR